MTKEQLLEHLCRGAVTTRSLDEIIGICKGIIADRTVNQLEAEFVVNWLEANKAVANEFPANVLYPRLVAMLADGVLDEEESKELLKLLQDMTGEQGQQATITLSTDLAYCDPLPPLTFVRQKFCLTGEFAAGKRPDVELRTVALGGSCVRQPVKGGCIVVVGVMGSDKWQHSTHGRKIREAVKMRDEGCPVYIVPEIHWHNWAEKYEQQQENRREAQAAERTSMQHAMRKVKRGE